MDDDPTLEQQWAQLKKETGMGDLPLQRQLEHFIFRQYGPAIAAHYVKILAILELSHNFYHRFRRQGRALSEPIFYWTVIAETNVNMLIQGVKDEESLITPPSRSTVPSQLDMLISCYFLYLENRQKPYWPPSSRKSGIIRDKWNSPELDSAYFPRLCRDNRDGHYANIMCIILRSALNSLLNLTRMRRDGERMLVFRRKQSSGSSAPPSFPQ